MLLSDSEIVNALISEEIIITPLINSISQIGSTSIDVRLGTEFRLIRRIKQTHFDLSKSTQDITQQVKKYTERVQIEPLEAFILHPDEFALGCTLEYIKLSNTIAGRLEGRSTWGRAGLQVHSTAGLIDPGFEGIVTFELHNLGKLPLPLYAGARIAQISFHRCEEVMRGYDTKSEAKYQRSIEIKDTLFYQEYEYQQIEKMRKTKPYLVSDDG
jgi:dCTP deaminase